MQTPAETYLYQVNSSNSARSSFRSIGRILSLLVIIGVFWGLKLTGITMAGEAFCGKEEHVHSESCDLRNLICTQEEVSAHSHSEECLLKTLVCTLPEQEGHNHNEECIRYELLCGQEEWDGHSHVESCIETTLVCELEEESHSHTQVCYTLQLICPEQEHQHIEDCFESQLTCQLEETSGHEHGAECFTETFTCQQEETEGHHHTESCYGEEFSYICQQEECAEHFHNEACYRIEEGQYICEQEETEGHSHTDACYEIWEACPVEAHIHTPNCYSDLSADLETSDDWNNAFSDMILGPSTAENILMVAKSQLGVSESIRNFEVDEAGVRRGITRYGQWYGHPYGDWSAMFTSFCLEYAGVKDLPSNAGPESMRMEWETAELYSPAQNHNPEPGQILFLDKDLNGSADAVAIITKLEEGVLFTIEGDLKEQVWQIGTVTLYPDGPPEAFSDEEIPEETPDKVMETLYAIGDPAIIGYGLVPFEPGLMMAAAPRAASRIIWLDGTNGGIMSLGGSPNTAYTAEDGTIFTLPDQWRSPDKYSYRLRGWYDVTNSKYYAPGAEVTVTGNMVFYADWAASTYDIGQFNSQVADTVSTNDFVTVRMFDYGVLFNVLSERADVTFSNSSHTETWNLLTSGNNPYNGSATLNYILRDWDKGSEDISYPKNTNAPNNPTDAGTVYSGLYTNTIRNLLFDPGTQVIGKQYLGTGDHLFQLCLDPNHEHYGYYYYNSERNAASYNQSAQRFYVYDYLECTRTSAGQGNAGKYSDFLPLNSPYANTNGKNVNTYNYVGIEGEYSGTTHYMYDCRYNDSNNSSNNVGTNFWFGMSVDIDFYIPNDPGTTVSGGYGNQDIYGKDMHFRFSGDDDVWVFVDGVMLLDLGGLHGMETGDINFSTGIVTINGTVNQQLSNNLKNISAGEHTLTLYYLERGSSMSNCAIYFNLAPRFSFSIQKEDVLTRDVLNGAQFSVYLDKNCTVPAQLWTSKLSHDLNEPSTNVFTVINGEANMWGMGAGNSYYIKETKGPDNTDYAGVSNGIIQLVFDKLGTANYNVDILDTGQGISNGFTVHGLRIDAETQHAYIVATNAPVWVEETTSIEVRKHWEDQVNHNADNITVYLTVTNQDGTVQRLREVTLSASNNWYHKWENLPKFWQDGTEVHYGVEEAYIPGYYDKVELVDTYTTTTKVWQETGKLENGKTYLLGTTNGYLSTSQYGEDTGYKWVSEETAMSSPLAQWTISASGNTYRLTNGSGQIITFYYGNGSPTDFFAYTLVKDATDSNYKQFLSYTASGNSIRLYFPRPTSSTRYFLSNMMDNGKFDENTDSNRAIVFTPKTLVETTVTQEKTAGWAYLISNTPLEQETSLTVQKYWDYADLKPGNLHEQLQITVKLLANGRDTGRTVTLSLKNGWRATFLGLPYVDDAGNVIAYSVEERGNNDDWLAYYGAVTSSTDSIPSYSTTITNRYIPGMGGPELPSTGSPARNLYILCGGSMMLSSLVYGILSRRKRERRMK